MAVLLLASQFGCASLSDRTAPALITDSDGDRIAEPEEEIDSWYLCDLIAEVSGKVEHYHHSDPDFKALYIRVAKLDSLRCEKELKHSKAMAKGMLRGAVLLPLTTLGIIAIILAKTGTGGDPVGPEILLYIWFAALIPQALAGASLGAVFTTVGSDPRVTNEMKNEILDIIRTYNDMAGKTREKPEGDQ